MIVRNGTLPADARSIGRARRSGLECKPAEFFAREPSRSGELDNVFVVRGADW